MFVEDLLDALVGVLEDLADRLDPEPITVLVDVVDQCALGIPA